ncbi:ATPase family associated with various cellular activities (AAA) domain-containing protein [Trichoderma breve]|uniref:ATPase family associated with various cellular activities (AAA) domain-containing protein n=1 Tax=Trichoderma breve TaxID=2034170 RepID=A0A9W9BG55_9HYPO|nr:ATPase family associated with various cellular activities (AAA) domain-containing protein [Trichoderma breve]KAJ4859770.1 ATPase family associated with various cellular activities (AAA) domain-containing protein [Trichoderma breve]
MSMSQPEGQEDLVKVADIRPLPFDASEQRQSSMNESNPQDGVRKNDAAKHHVIPDESALRSSTTDSPQALQDVASPESLGDTNCIVFDKEAADSDTGTIENMSLGDFQIPEESPEPAASTPLEAYQAQLMRIEARGKKPLQMTRQEQPEPDINLLQQKYESRWKLLEEQTKTRLVMARQEQPEPATGSTQPDYELQLRLLEAQNKRRIEMARQEQSKLNTQQPHLEAQSKQSSEMTGQEQPKPAISLAQQDYEQQLRLLEAQNKKRLQMARQEQSPLNIQPPQTQMKMKGSPEPNVMAIMPSTQGNATAGSGNMMATLPPGARYFVPASTSHPSNPVAMDVKIIPNSEAQPTTLSMPPNPPGSQVLDLQRQLRVFKLKNQVLKRQLNESKGLNFAIFHCFIGQEGEETYLGKPYWIKSGDKFQLKAYPPVLYPDAYILYKPLAFVIYRYYSSDISTEDREALQQGHMPEPEPIREVIKLFSDDIIKAVKLFEKEDEEAQKKLSVKKEMSAPYRWWYHYRANRNKISNLPKAERKLIHLLANWIDVNYSELYDRVDDQFKRGVVSAASLPFLVQPGEVLVHKEKRNSEMQVPPEDPDWTFLSVPSPKNSDWSWEVDAWSYVYSGNFYRLMRRLVINLDVATADTEVPILDLDVFPLRFASQELRETLERRGKTFWNSRYGNYVSYYNQNKNEEHAEESYMIDWRAYATKPPLSMPGQRATPKENDLIPEFKVKSRYMQIDLRPSEPDVYLFPRTAIGYHLQRKEWNHLNVDQIQQMPWNEKAFGNIASDVEMKELVQALIATKISAADIAKDWMRKKDDILITVLHGGPGTGKPFTTESIAEIAQGQILQVKCSKPDITAEYLKSMFHDGGRWRALLMFEDAEALLEQRSLDGVPSTTLVSDFLSEVERFDGLIILTSKSAGDLDELLKSRTRLSVHYETSTQQRRAQIWRNFLSQLDPLGEKNIDFDGINTHMDELSEKVISEHQICNAMTTAWQLAQFQGKMMTIDHLRYVNSWADLREGMTLGWLWPGSHELPNYKR